MLVVPGTVARPSPYGASEFERNVETLGDPVENECRTSRESILLDGKSGDPDVMV